MNLSCRQAMDCNNELRAPVVCLLMMHAKSSQREGRDLTIDLSYAHYLPNFTWTAKQDLM